MLKAENVTVQYGDLKVLDELSFDVYEGDWFMVAGPNGAGKSTIVNAISGGAPYSGKILSLGEDIRKIKSREKARRLGILSQSNTVGYAFTVEEVVRLGRYSHTKSILNQDSRSDEDAINDAIDKAGLRELTAQSVLTLSGGELQRVFIAQLFAQNPALLILDEPTNHLDLAYQQQVFALISEWLKTPGRAVISVVHDLSLAKAYGTKAILLNSGKTVAEGAPSAIFTRETLKSVYNMDVYEWFNKMLSQWEV